MLVVGLTQLSEYLAAAKDGKGVLITERGKAIALMIPEGLGAEGKACLLRELARQGLRARLESE